MVFPEKGNPCKTPVSRSEQTPSPLAGEGWDEGAPATHADRRRVTQRAPATILGQIKEVELLYEYRVYEAMPGKLVELHARFRDHTLELFEKHGIRNVGYWTVDVGDANDRLIYIVAFEDAADRERAWASFGADPEWHSVVAESEANGKLVARILNSTLTPTDYSPLR